MCCGSDIERRTKTLSYMEPALPLTHTQMNCIERIHTISSLFSAPSEQRTWLQGILYVYQWQCTPSCQTLAGPTSNKKSILPHLFTYCALSSSLTSVCEIFDISDSMESENGSEITLNSGSFQATELHEQTNLYKATEAQ